MHSAFGGPPVPPRCEGAPARSTLAASLVRLTEGRRRDCLVVVLLHLAVVGAGVAVVALTGLGIDVIRNAAADSGVRSGLGATLSSLFGAGSLESMAAIAASVVIAASVHAVLRVWSAVAVARLAQRIMTELRTKLYDRLLAMPVRYFDETDHGSIVNRLTTDVHAIQAFLGQVVVQLIVVVISLALYVYYMVSIHLLLTIACLATSPIIWLSAVRFVRTTRPLYRHHRVLMDHVAQVLAESVQGAAVIKVFQQQERVAARFQRATGDVRHNKLMIAWHVSVFRPCVNLLMHLNLAIVIGGGGYLIIAQQLTLGVGLFVFAALLRQFSTQIAQLTELSNKLAGSRTAIERLFAFLDAPGEPERGATHVLAPGNVGTVTFRDVSFGYRSDEPILRGINLTVKAGDVVAVLGPTGSGKSTFLQLMLRLYSPTQGRVCVGGVDLQDWDVERLRQHIGVVFQETRLMHDTVFANIAFGNVQATPAQVEWAAQVACADEFIRQLPNGYETVIGENGHALSGGQRQRLAIARAVLCDPAILILDEPTSAIDRHTEHEVSLAISRAMHGRTVFVVARRAPMFQRIDSVVTISDGRVTQTGAAGETGRARVT